jgi:hypothetical protein
MSDRRDLNVSGRLRRMLKASQKTSSKQGLSRTRCSATVEHAQLELRISSPRKRKQKHIYKKTKTILQENKNNFTSVFPITA